MSTPATYFEHLYCSADPYGYRTRWYEARKRALLLASLPQRRYANAWELGCSIGVTTAQLAGVCDALLATDASATAIAAARRGVTARHVQFRVADHPREWVDGRFDLIAFSEIGYFMEATALASTIERLHASLAPEGLLVACHWRRPFAEAPLDGDRVHAALHAALPLAPVFAYVDEDFRLEGWSAQADSVAQREFLS